MADKRLLVGVETLLTYMTYICLDLNANELDLIPAGVYYEMNYNLEANGKYLDFTAEVKIINDGYEYKHLEINNISETKYTDYFKEYIEAHFKRILSVAIEDFYELKCNSVHFEDHIFSYMKEYLRNSLEHSHVSVMGNNRVTVTFNKIEEGGDVAPDKAIYTLKFEHEDEYQKKLIVDTLFSDIKPEY